MRAACPWLLIRTIDTGTACSIAGAEWEAYGQRLPGGTRVLAVEGLGGKKIKVEGLYRFQVQLQDGQDMSIDCLDVDGCEGEFLLGSDFARAHHANMDYRGGCLTLDTGDGLVLPFRSEDESDGEQIMCVSSVK